MKMDEAKLQKIITELKQEISNIEDSFTKLTKFSNIQGSGEAYDILKSTTSYVASDIRDNLVLMLTSISQNLQQMHDDIKTQDTLLSEAIKKDKEK